MGMTNVPSAVSGVELGWAYDTQNQVIGGGVVGGVFHTFDPITKNWTATTMNVSSPVDGRVINTMSTHTLDYDVLNGVYVFQSYAGGYGSRTWAYRSPTIVRGIPSWVNSLIPVSS